MINDYICMIINGNLLLSINYKWRFMVIIQWNHPPLSSKIARWEVPSCENIEPNGEISSHVWWHQRMNTYRKPNLTWDWQNLVWNSKRYVLFTTNSIACLLYTWRLLEWWFGYVLHHEWPISNYSFYASLDTRELLATSKYNIDQNRFCFLLPATGKP